MKVTSTILLELVHLQPFSNPFQMIGLRNILQVYIFISSDSSPIKNREMKIATMLERLVFPLEDSVQPDDQ